MTQAGLISSTEDELDPTSLPMEDQLLNPFIILIPVLLVALIIAAIVGGIVISRRCNRKVEKRGASVTQQTPECCQNCFLHLTAKPQLIYSSALVCDRAARRGSIFRRFSCRKSSNVSINCLFRRTFIILSL